MIAMGITEKTEIENLWNRYMWGMGKEVENLSVGSAIMAYYPLTQNYFNKLKYKFYWFR